MLNVNGLSGGNPSDRLSRSDGCRGGWMLKARCMGPRGMGKDEGIVTKDERMEYFNSDYCLN